MRYFRMFTLLVVLLVAVLPNAKIIHAVPITASGDSAFGVGSNLASRYGGLPSLDSAVNALADSGTGWAREDFQWQVIQPAPNQFSWDVIDRVVDALRTKGINILGVLSGPTPGWAATGTNNTFAAPDPQRFAAFAQAVADHFKGRVRYWQIWNEPENALYWQPSPDAGAYATLLKTVYPAIKSANPDAQILLGGVVPTHLDYLRGIYLNDAWSSFDILGLHPYVDPKSPEQGQIGTGDVSAVKALAGDLGQKPIWATELGWATGPVGRDSTGVDEQSQANYLVRGMALLRAAGVDKVIWYSFKDDSNGPYGLVRAGSDPGDYSQRKPAFDAFRALNQQVGALGSASLQPLGDARVIFDFESFGVWSPGTHPEQKKGTFTPSMAQHHSGQASGKLGFAPTSASNEFVVFSPQPAIAIPDGTSQLGIWVYTDHYAHELKVWLTEATGETLQFRMGFPGKGGWQYLSSSLAGQVEGYNVVANKQNQRLDFPAKLTAIVLDDYTDTTVVGGDIYLDDITAVVGSEAYAVRFPSGDSNVTDILWAPQGAHVVIPAASGQIQLDLGPSPIFQRYTPASSAPPEMPVGCVGPGQCPSSNPTDPSIGMTKCGRSPTINLDTCNLQPGDILLEKGDTIEDDLISIGSYFNHTALYLGNQEVAEAIGVTQNRVNDVLVRPIKQSAWWREGIQDWVVMRPNVSAEVISSAIRYARKKAADPKVVYNLSILPPGPSREDERLFYCSKLVWKAYAQAGVDLEVVKGFYVIPDDLYTTDRASVQYQVVNPALDTVRPPRRTRITIHSPAHLMLIDAQGRRTGFDPATGATLNEIPNIRYSGTSVAIETITATDLQGVSQLFVSGFASGDYHIEVVYLDKASPRSQTIVASTTPGRVDQFTLPDPDDPKTTNIIVPPADLLPPAPADIPAISNGSFADQGFQSVWERTDKPIADGARGLTPRSWIWGPQPLTNGTSEPYAEGSGGVRLVQYFDKSRMEINDPSAPRNQWFVTNGLLVVEMIEGRIQVGNSTFQDRAPADEPVAGDPGEGNPNAPTYRSFRSVAYPITPQRASKRTGEAVTDVLARDGSISRNPDLARYNIILDAYEDQLGHNIPKVFTTFFAQQGLVYEGGRYLRRPVFDWLFVMGLPISEPYWAHVKIGGIEKDVLMQAFQRRVLTYTPGNSAGFEVEMGNVGQHYLRWRYQH